MIKNRPLWQWFLPFIALSLIMGIFFIEPIREIVFIFIHDSYIFIKKNIITILTAFFLINGKFVLNLFLRKIILLSATGLGKRYMIERVINHQIKVHFLDHLKDDFKRLMEHIKHNFENFPLVKKLMTGFAFLSSLGFVGKFMGGVLALKVFVAKIWSFLLALFLKFFTSVFYFFTKILWGSWLAPILEVIVFSWFLEWLEKIPLLKSFFTKIYKLFSYFFGWIEYLITKLMKAPLRRFLKWLVKKMKRAIYAFIGYEKVSMFRRLQEARNLNPNSHIQLLQFRKNRKMKKDYCSAREKLQRKREERKNV